MTKEKKKILIIGGGFAGLFTALDLAGDVDVTLVTETNHFTFRPLLYEYFSGEVEAWHIAPDYKELIGDDINFMRGSVETIDFETQTVKVSTRNELFSYDALVLAVGGVTNFWNVEGAEEFALPFRDVADADKLRREMEKALDAVSPTLAPQDARDELTFAVVGGGASGVELATKMSDLLTDAFARRGLKGEPHILLFEMSDRLVPGMGEEIREYVEKTLLKDHIDVNLQTRVLEVRSQKIVSEHNSKRSEIKTVATVWTAGVKMNPLIEKLDLPKDKNGLILVEPTMQVKTRENVFALGDIAKVEEVAPILAGTAQLAFQESALAANNIIAFLSGKTLQTKHFEELGEALSLGTKNAAVLIGGNIVGGFLARDARFALYTSRLPTWHHRLRVGASWFFEGTTPKPLQPLGIS